MDLPSNENPLHSFRTRQLQSQAEAEIAAARAEAEAARLAAAKSRVLEAETQTIRTPSPPPRPPPPTIVVEDEVVERPVAPAFVVGLQVRIVNHFRSNGEPSLLGTGFDLSAACNRSNK